MADRGNPEDPRYFVGSVEDVDDFTRGLGGAGEVVEREGVDGGSIVLVVSTYAMEKRLLPQLGANAYAFEYADEAARAFRKAAEGRPYEPPESISESA